MRTILIIEDEPLAAKRLESLILQCTVEMQIVAICDSIESSVSFLQANGLPDLIFMDIQLADGLSFTIFDHIEVSCPVIFTTAYEEYAIKAFKVNSVDYLLKPIDIADLQQALTKYESLHSKTQSTISSDIIKSVQAAIAEQQSSFKSRFAIRIGEHIKSLPVEDIACFYSLEKATYLSTKEGRSYTVDYTLDAIENMLSPRRFFRINRSYIISHEAIVDIVSYSNSRLKVTLANNSDTHILVSRERVGNFKLWLEG